MENIELNIKAIANAESDDGKYAVILEEVNGKRSLPIIIGAFEAQAIAIIFENMQFKRPMTHDLFKNTLETVGVTITSVLIAELKDDIFHALIVGRQQNGKPFNVDARSSDAIAMAVRFGCPIFTTESVMKEASLEMEFGREIKREKTTELSDYSKEELDYMLKKALEEEDYEKAAKIRDILGQKS